MTCDVPPFSVPTDATSLREWAGVVTDPPTKDLLVRLADEKLAPPTDDDCRRALRAVEPNRIMGFHYPPHFVIRDLWREWKDQILWRGPDDDRVAFEDQLAIEKMRLVLKAAREPS